jgi:hypothetical protein
MSPAAAITVAAITGTDLREGFGALLEKEENPPARTGGFRILFARSAQLAPDRMYALRSENACSRIRLVARADVI